RHGATVGRLKTSDTSPREIARMMVGRDVALAQDTTRTPSVTRQGAGTHALLDVRDLVVPSSRRANAVDGVTFSVAAGEILGIAGVEGNGQTELIEAIAGLRHATSGAVLLDGSDVTR